MSQNPDEIDQQIDRQIDSFFDRWPWKLGRLIQTSLLILLVVWLLLTIGPVAVAYVLSPDFGAGVLQVLVLALYLLLFVFIQVLLIYLLFTRTRIQWTRPGGRGTRLDDYHGNPEAREAATSIVALLRGVKDVRLSGGDIVRGVLLVGQPGAGKRYLARIIAHEAAVPIGYLSATSLTTARLGLGALKVARIYRKARKMAREYGACIVLIDEIDTLAAVQPSGHSVESSERSSSQRQRSLGELLLQVDPPFPRQSWWHRFVPQTRPTSRPAVLTIATTSRPDMLDAALCAPGRFDRQLPIDLPDREGRRAIIAYYLDMLEHEDLSPDQLAADTEGCTPALLRQALQEAIIYTRVQGRHTVTYEDVVYALTARGVSLPQPAEQAALEPSDSPPPLTYTEQRRIACYRAGGIYLRARVAAPASVNGAAGLVVAAEDEPAADQGYPRSRVELLADLQVALAGRAAEEELLGIQTISAATDLRRATRLAGWLTGAYGMNGDLFSYLAGGQEDLYAEVTYGDLHHRTEALLKEQYSQVQAAIHRNREAVAAIAEALTLHPDLSPTEQHRLLERLESRYPFASADNTLAAPSWLVAHRAPPRTAPPPDNSGQFVQPEPPQPAEEPVAPVSLMYADVATSTPPEERASADMAEPQPANDQQTPAEEETTHEDQQPDSGQDESRS